MSNYMSIRNLDINNGPGLRVSVWFSGCAFECKGCHNKESWDFEAGKKFTNNEINKVLELIDNDGVNLSILGGEPLHSKNINSTLELIEAVRSKFGSDKTIWMWTGFTKSELDNRVLKGEAGLSEILLSIDTIIEGRYIESLANKGLKYRGSGNQRIVNLK